MNNPTWSQKAVIALLCCAVAGATATAHASASENRVAAITIDQAQVVFDPVTDNGSIVLTVAGPEGFFHSEQFEPGAKPAFSVGQKGGRQLADGIYTYEIKSLPVLDAESRKLLALARQQGSESAIEELRARGALPARSLVQTGRVTVQNGLFVVPGAPEVSTKDIVHLDDVIIDGSLCVGNDCYSGLAFGFDTIVLMENNLRIFFDDTSTIQNYPRNDWRLIANDSTDGGGRYFAIEDATDVSNILVLEAGAPDNSLYVDSHGDVGINTSTPYYELHIVDGDSPAVRLEQDGSYGWTPQKWDLCGNESNFFIRDATHGSKLPFRIEPDAPTDSIFIKSNGNVGIGTSSPNATLHIDGSLVVTGTSTPDYVFEPGYELESIEEHAKLMWEKRHLPAVRPNTVNEEGKSLIDVGARSQGVLEELETAHIYIEQLHKRLARLKALTIHALSQEAMIQAQEQALRVQQQVLQDQQETIRALEARLSAVEESL